LEGTKKERERKERGVKSLCGIRSLYASEGGEKEGKRSRATATRLLDQVEHEEKKMRKRGEKGKTRAREVIRAAGD